MIRFTRFVVISFVLHFILFFALIDINPSGAQHDLALAGIYEVSIVSEDEIGTITGSAQTWQKVIRESVEKVKGLSAVEREAIISENMPSLSPKELNPPKTESTLPSNYASEILKSIDKRIDFSQTTDPTSNAISSLSSEIPVSSQKGDTKGGTNKAQDDQTNIYKARIKEIIKGYWKTPPEIAFLRRTLKATYMMSIVKNGEVVDRKLVSSSGNNAFDASIFRALENVKNLPSPPPSLVSADRTLDIVITFTSEELK